MGSLPKPTHANASNWVDFQGDHQRAGPHFLHAITILVVNNSQSIISNNKSSAIYVKELIFMPSIKIWWQLCQHTCHYQ